MHLNYYKIQLLRKTYFWGKTYVLKNSEFFFFYLTEILLKNLKNIQVKFFPKIKVYLNTYR